jgi:CheY-like chemotaxis protein/two-component sensor histidine kinase
MDNDSSTKHLAHDLNNIFTRILNSIDLLKRKVSASSDLLPLLNNIEAGTYLASEMIADNFGDKSRKKNQRRINLNSIISDVVRSFSFQQKGRIDFILSLDPNLKIVSGNYSDYYRVVLNLITNAVESIEKTGIISLSTANIDDETKVEFIITDNGSGIDEETIPFIFDEDFSTKDKKTISGIGLSIVKKIVEENSGTVTVSSEFGKGTEFKIILKAAPIADIHPAQNGKTILVAEDEEILRELLAELLQSYNYTVLTSSNGREVLDILKIRIPDLLIIDRRMPEMDGIECIKEISALNYNIPVILATGSQTDDYKIDSININRAINKPYNFEELLALVRELIG